jgi:hypothetical protein
MWLAAKIEYEGEYFDRSAVWLIGLFLFQKRKIVKKSF